MWVEMLLIACAALTVSAVLTGAVRRLSWRHGVLDVPNPRSSHAAITARGGGLAIVIAASLALPALRALRLISTDLLLALLVGGAVVALVGYLDDRQRLPASARLAVHTAAALWALFCLGGLPPILVGHRLVDLGWYGQLLSVLGIVWTLNLFNFMDGIDGIAASEAVFIALSGVLLSLLLPQTAAPLAAGLAFAAACLGFLLWNWPPASIFMGDVGSGYLGFFIAVLALADMRRYPAALWVWLILGAVFLVDATVTLVRRARRGERLHEAHRSHGYQWLTRRWGSHRRVTMLAIAINLGWLLPCAALAALKPEKAVWIALAALVPLIIAALVAGSGRRESGAA
jgi:Fuc2NAc and GlcNAc transferase